MKMEPIKREGRIKIIFFRVTIHYFLNLEVRFKGGN
jgi:hypothetical protein